MHLHRFITVGMASCMLSLAHAEQVQDTWRGPVKLNLSLYVFAADVKGSIDHGQISYAVDQPFKETLKHLDQAYMGYVDLSKGKWGAYLDHQMVKTSEQKQLLQLPLALKTELQQSSYGLYYQAYRSEQTSTDGYAKLIVEPSIGVRHTEAKAELAAIGNRVKADQSWNEFIWGTRLKYNFDSSWNIAAQVNVGHERSINVESYLGYRLKLWQQPLNLRIGYRYFDQHYRQGQMNWDISQSGPVLGINLALF